MENHNCNCPIFEHLASCDNETQEPGSVISVFIAPDEIQTFDQLNKYMEQQSTKPTLKFTKEIKQQWLDALRSGKYIQGFFALTSKSEDDGKIKHCCIGVLGDIHPDLRTDTCTPGQNPYDFLEATIGDKTCRDIITANDDAEYIAQGHNDYRNVISLIEALPTQE